MKKKLLQYGLCSAVGLAIAIWFMASEGLFQAAQSSAKEVIFILCDAFFVPGVFLVSIGALVWVSTTGFFDAIGYAFRVAGHLFLPFARIERKSFYDYKMEKAEKRSSTPHFILIVGAGFLAIAGIMLLLWSAL